MAELLIRATLRYAQMDKEDTKLRAAMSSMTLKPKEETRRKDYRHKAQLFLLKIKSQLDVETFEFACHLLRTQRTALLFVMTPESHHVKWIINLCKRH